MIFIQKQSVVRVTRFFLFGKEGLVKYGVSTQLKRQP